MSPKVPSRMPALRLIGRACLVMLTAAACRSGDGPTEPVQNAGSMSFTYSGAESGSFSVSGMPGPDLDGASGVRYRGSPSMLIVTGRRSAGATRRDFLDMWLSDVSAPGPVSLSGSECLFTMLDCPLVVFGRNVPVTFDPELEPDGFYIFTGGTVDVTTVNAARIAGTFQGTAEWLTSGGTRRVVTITNGKFDVPLISVDKLN